MTARTEIAADGRPGVVGDDGQRRKNLIAFGREVRRRRAALGLTLESFAGIACLSPNYIGSVETGRRNPSLTSMLSIASGLGTSLGEMFGLPKTPPEAVEAWRLLCALPSDARVAFLAAVRALVVPR